MDVNYLALVPQLKEDLKKYNVMSNLNDFKFVKTINIKWVFYRTISLYVLAVGRIHGIQKNSSFEIIDELKQRGKITKEVAQRLSLAVAVGCHIRMAHYLSQGQQKEKIEKEDETIGGKDKFEELAKMVKPMHLIRSLVAVASLQTVLQQNQPFSYLETLRCYERGDVFTVMMAFGLPKQVTKLGEQIFEHPENMMPADLRAIKHFLDAYLLNEQPEKCIRANEKFRKSFNDQIASIQNKRQKMPNERNLGPTAADLMDKCLKYNELDALFALGRCSDALKKVSELLNHRSNLDEDDLKKCFDTKSKCEMNLKKHKEALSSLTELQKIYALHKTSGEEIAEALTKRHIAICWLNIGIGNCKKAIDLLEEYKDDIKKINGTNDLVQEVASMIDCIKKFASNPASISWDLKPTPTESMYVLGNTFKQPSEF